METKLSTLDEYIKNNPNTFKKIIVDPSLEDYIINSCRNKSVIDYYNELYSKTQKQWNKVFKDINRLNPSVALMDKVLFDLIPGKEEYEYYMEEFDVSFRTAMSWLYGIDMEEYNE